MDTRPTLATTQAAGFPMGGEPLVALDLVDTLMLVTDPPTDLLNSPENAATWWTLESSSLPEGPLPDMVATRRLRAAIRELFDAHLEDRVPAGTSIDDVNAACGSVPTSMRLVIEAGDRARAETRWHVEHGGNPLLAAIAQEAIELLSAPDRLRRLRRCANPDCSMLFLAETDRRKWCTANICGNRVRVARHYERTHSAPPESSKTHLAAKASDDRDEV